MNKIHFEKANPLYQPIIFSWLEEPHMQEFWDNSQAHKDDIINFINGRVMPSDYFNGLFTYWIGFSDNSPFSFIMTSEISPEEDLPPAWRENLSTTGKTFSLDFSIGNPNFLGKGLAAPALKQFITFFQNKIEPKADTFLIDPDVNNPRAKHVYEKAGFLPVADFAVNSGYFAGSHASLMVMKLK